MDDEQSMSQATAENPLYPFHPKISLFGSQYCFSKEVSLVLEEQWFSMHENYLVKDENDKQCYKITNDIWRLTYTVHNTDGYPIFILKRKKVSFNTFICITIWRIY